MNFSIKNLAILIVLNLFFVESICAQTDANQSNKKFKSIEMYAHKISKHTLEDHVRALCAPEMQGRKIETEGNKKAQNYIISQFKKYDVVPTNDGWYEQFFKSGSIYGANLIGIVEGSEHPERSVIIAAHYDGIGVDSTGTIMPCADDNATGTAAVIEIAGAITAAAKDGLRPKNTMIFVTFDGSKQGLIGSRHYRRFPLKTLLDVDVMINMDMMGRADCGLEKGKEKYVFLIGNPMLPPQMRKICDSINAVNTKLKLEYNFYNNNEVYNLFYPTSDHYSFSDMLPTIFFCGGINADVQSSGDTADKISYSVLRSRTLLALYTAWYYANN